MLLITYPERKRITYPERKRIAYHPEWHASQSQRALVLFEWKNYLVHVLNNLFLTHTYAITLPVPQMPGIPPIPQLAYSLHGPTLPLISIPYFTGATTADMPGSADAEGESSWLTIPDVAFEQLMNLAPDNAPSPAGVVRFAPAA